MQQQHAQRLIAVAALAVLLSACGGNSDDAPVAEETRAQDSRSFTATAAAATTFAAMTAATGDTVDVATTSRYAGMLDGAAYQVEVPANWNGKLVMYAHGFRGNDVPLTVGGPSIRRHLI